jgi:hypothetical protein
MVNLGEIDLARYVYAWLPSSVQYLPLEIRILYCVRFFHA